MPHFVFTLEPPQAGCVERVCMFSPWPQAQQAWNWLLQYAQQPGPFGQPMIMFAQGAKVSNCTCTNQGGQGQQPNVYCVQRSMPTVDRQQVNAPYNTPLANGYNLTPPPVAGPSGQRRDPLQNPQGMYEDLTDAALAASADAVFGEMDGAGGTFTDVDSRGNETLRGITAPYPKKVTG